MVEVVRLEFPPILTPAQVSQMVGLKVDTLYRYRQAGIGPEYIRINSRVVRYEREAVLAWFSKHRV